MIVFPRAFQTDIEIEEDYLRIEQERTSDEDWDVVLLTKDQAQALLEILPSAIERLCQYTESETE